MGISEKRVSATDSRQKVIARAARVSENENPIEVFRKMFISQRKGGVDGITSRGKLPSVKGLTHQRNSIVAWLGQGEDWLPVPHRHQEFLPRTKGSKSVK